MNKGANLLSLLTVCGLVGLVALSGTAFGQENTDSREGQYKIAVVNRKEAFDGYNKQKEEFAKLEKEMADMQTELDKVKARLDAKKDEYDQNKDNMTEEQQEDLKAGYQQDLIQYESQVKESQKQLDVKSNNLMRRMKSDIDKVIQDIGREENYHIILEGDPNNPMGVLYYHAAIDITPKVVMRLNQTGTASAN